MTKKIFKIVAAICVLFVVVMFTDLPEQISDIIETHETKSSETHETKSAVSNIIGRWERDEGNGIRKLEFFSDGTYTSDHPNYNGNYSIDGHRLKLSGILVEPLVYSFDTQDDKLILTPDSGDVRYFTKIKQ